MKRRISLALAFIIMSVSALSGCGRKAEPAIDDNYRNYYEIFVRSFYDSDGDGVGDFNGITEKLDYISDMGFTGIWLMPIMPTTTYHGYDVTDYMAVNPEYGSIEDFDRLVSECHSKGIRLIIDMVMNHSSSRHPWFMEACDYLRSLKDGAQPDEGECPYLGYYHFSREKENETWYGVNGTDWYYEGSFWSEMPDLNLDNEALRREFETVSDFWLSHGIDGYRMDAVMHFEEQDIAGNNERLSWIYQYCKGIHPDFYMVSEVWAGESAIAFYYGSGTPSMFNFPASGAEGVLEKAARGKGGASRLVDAMLEYQEAYGAANPDYIDAPFLTNHDQPRVANNLMDNEEQLKMAAGLLLTMSGNPFVYYGEEIGMDSYGQKDENKRLPMRWSEADTKGICKPPVGADADIDQAMPALDEQQSDETSLLNYYKRALAVRNANPEIARGVTSAVDSLCEKDTAAILRTWTRTDETTGEEKTSKVGIIYNTSKDEVQVDITGTELEDMKVAGSMTLDGVQITMSGNVITMPGQSICVIR